MKLNPFLQAIYELEQAEGGILNVDENDPRLKRIIGMHRESQQKDKEKLNDTTIAVINLLNEGLNANQIARELKLTARHIRDVIKKNHLVTKYVVIEDTNTEDKRLFRTVDNILKVFKKLDIKIGYRKVMDCLDNQKLYDDRYRFYRVKEIRQLD